MKNKSASATRDIISTTNNDTALFMFSPPFLIDYAALLSFVFRFYDIIFNILFSIGIIALEKVYQLIFAYF